MVCLFSGVDFKGNLFLYLPFWLCAATAPECGREALVEVAQFPVKVSITLSAYFIRKVYKHT